MKCHSDIPTRTLLLWLSICIVGILSNCPHKSTFDRLDDGDFTIVTKGTFRGKTIFLRDGGQYRETVDAYRVAIESRLYLLPMIIRKHYIVPEKLDFLFKYATIEQERELLILRYFARVLHHPVHAGYQIQFVFEMENNTCTAIYASEVPLE